MPCESYGSVPCLQVTKPKETDRSPTTTHGSLKAVVTGVAAMTRAALPTTRTIQQRTAPNSREIPRGGKDIYNIKHMYLMYTHRYLTSNRISHRQHSSGDDSNIKNQSYLIIPTLIISDFQHTEPPSSHLTPKRSNQPTTKTCYSIPSLLHLNNPPTSIYRIHRIQVNTKHKTLPLIQKSDSDSGTANC